VSAYLKNFEIANGNNTVTMNATFFVSKFRNIFEWKIVVEIFLFVFDNYFFHVDYVVRVVMLAYDGLGVCDGGEF
jgi:hypothetical protein